MSVEGVLAVFLSWCTLGVVFAAAAGPAVPPAVPIVRVLRLSADELAGTPAVAVRGTVTYLRPGVHSELIIQDDSGGLLVSVGRSDLDALAVGAVVEVAGEVRPGNFSPRLYARTIRRVGVAPPPAAEAATADDLWSGRLDCRRVELRGVIRRAVVDRTLDPPRLIATLATPAGSVDLWVLAFDPAAADGLIDATVVARGVCLIWGTPRRQLRGFRVVVPDLADVRTTRPPGDPADLPTTSPATFGRYNPDGVSLRRVKTRGVVTWQQPGDSLVLQTGPIGLRVRSPVPRALNLGDIVEAVGFPAVSGVSTELHDATFCRVGPGVGPEPVPLNILALGEQPDDADVHLRLVRVRGTLQLVHPAEGGSRLHLEEHGVYYTAFLPGEPPFWKVGSVLELTGVCELQPSTRIVQRGGSADRFALRLRGPADVAVVRAGPWLSRGRLGVALGGLAVVSAVALFWVVTLRRMVARRTARLAHEISARHDAEVGHRAVGAERARLAAELHDTLQQGLTGAALQVEAATLAGRARPAETGQHLDLAGKLLAGVRRQLREAIHDLHAEVTETSLPAELEELAEAMSPAADPKVTVRVTGRPRPIPELVAHHTIRAAREALANAVRHAAATAVSLELEYQPAALALSVRDDGVGFRADGPGRRPEGYGLAGLRDRAARAGASLSIASTPGAGTTVVWHMPLAGRGTDG